MVPDFFSNRCAFKGDLEMDTRMIKSLVFCVKMGYKNE